MWFLRKNVKDNLGLFLSLMLVNTMVCGQLAANGLIKIQKLTEEKSENT